MRSEAVSGWRLAVSQSALRRVLPTAYAARFPFDHSLQAMLGQSAGHS
jgi:hypothetical protein